MNYTVLSTIILLCVTVLIHQHRAFSSTRYAELKEQIKATQIAIAQVNAWQIQIATYLKIELTKAAPKKGA